MVPHPGPAQQPCPAQVGPRHLHQQHTHPAARRPATRSQVLAVVREATATIRAPIVLFTYYNPIMARGLDKFCQQAKEAGAAGAFYSLFVDAAGL